MAKAATTLQLSRRTKFVYGLGTVAFGVKDTAFSAFLLLYYNQIVGMPADMVGAAIMIALVIDALADPVIGQVSDHWRSRWGRRHPFMYAAALPASISFLMLWLPPAGWSQAALFAYLVTVIILVRTFITLYEIPSAALAAELTSDYDERTTILSYRLLMALIGGAAASMMAYGIFLRPTPEFPVGQLNPDGYPGFGAAAAVMIFVSILASAAGTHSQIPHLRAPPAQRPGSLAIMAREMVSTLADRAFLIILLAALFAAAASGVAGSLALYFATYFWTLPSSQLPLLVLPWLGGALLAAPATPWISRRCGKKATLVMMLCGGGVLVVAPIALRLIGFFPDNGSPFLLPVLMGDRLISAALQIGCLILVGSMVADLSEQAELRTGRRSEGLLMAAFSLVMKAVSGIGVFVSGAILTVVDFPADRTPGSVAPGVLHDLGLAFILVQAAIYAAAAIIISRHRVDRSAHERTLAALSKRTAAPATESPIETNDPTKAEQPMTKSRAF
ncbi:MAG: MFS transporter [Sphingopyxis sp.]|nr:MFS transporter [Sphingopyxis sp.]